MVYGSQHQEVVKTLKKAKQSFACSYETGESMLRLAQRIYRDNCFWTKNPVMLPGATEATAATAWEQYDKKVVKELLTYHIVRGEWSYFNIDSSDRWIETYGEGSFSYNKDGQTLQGDTAVMCVKAGHDRNLPLQLNNFEWNFRGLLAASSGSCRTTNIHARDGYIHVSDWWQPRPSRYFLGQE